MRRLRPTRVLSVVLRYVSLARNRVLSQLDREDYVQGEIRCPGCHAGVKMGGACNVITCRSSKHKDGFFYFCAHCKAACPNGESYCRSCPHRNDRATRARVQAARSEFLSNNSAANPCVLDDD